MSTNPFRLPGSIVPDHYRIELAPDLSGDTFTGSVVIEADVVTATDVITLNADELTIEHAAVSVAGGAAEPCEAIVDVDAERIALRLGDALSEGPITIELGFSGRFNQQLVGLYLSHFNDADDVERCIASTQFEATYARKCFPCWDEPAFKATFELSLIIDSDHEAVANSAEIGRSVLDDGRLKVDFAKTMVMSTYLVAFVIGPLEFSETIDVDGVPLRVVHVPGRSGLDTFALEAGAFALRYFADYFDVPYPGDKLDLIAIPDFAFGAMENLGCVTFREVVLLIDTTQATQTELQRAADVINHEIAHMWFGDLVTMAWWNGLWLNEAFATFMEMRCTDAFRPEWQRWVDFSLSRTEAFDTDALGNTRPIEFEVVSPSEAEGMFDILTYEKGAAVVRMLEQYLGEERFRDGIRRYMAENQYGNAETTDLWDAIEAESGEPVRRIMDSWIFQGGFPLVSVDGDGTEINLGQERMSYEGGDEADDTIWATPVRYRWKATGDEEPRNGRALLDTTSTTLDLPEAPDWLIANAEGSGFFRVAYSDDQLDRLADVAPEELGPVERYAIVDDAYAALLAGRASSLSFLNLIEAMSGESDRSVWQRLISGLRQLDRLVDGEAQERLQEIAHDVLAPPLASLGLAPRDDDDDRSRQLRGDLVRALGTVADDPEIQEEAKRTVAAGRRDPELVDAALMAASVDVVASVGDEADFDDFVDSWKKAETPQEEIRYLNSLTDFTEPELTARLHHLVLDGAIRSQNAPFLLARSMANRHAGQRTWEFVATNWDQLIDMFPTGAIPRMLSGVARLDRPEQARATAAFFAEHTIATGERTLRQILERQRVHVALWERESERLASFLTA